MFGVKDLMEMLDRIPIWKRLGETLPEWTTSRIASRSWRKCSEASSPVTYAESAAPALCYWSTSLVQI